MVDGDVEDVNYVLVINLDERFDDIFWVLRLTSEVKVNFVSCGFDLESRQRR